MFSVFTYPFLVVISLGKIEKNAKKPKKKHPKSFAIVNIISGILPFRYIHLNIKFGSYFIKFYFFSVLNFINIAHRIK